MARQGKSWNQLKKGLAREGRKIERVSYKDFETPGKIVRRAYHGKHKKVF